MIEKAIETVIKHKEVPTEVMSSALCDILESKASDIQIAAFLTALHMKGETINELTSAVLESRKHYNTIFAGTNAVEIVGTGGDGSGSFNISTAAAILASAADIPILKCGNRAVTSQSGSADILEALGCNISISEDLLYEVFKRCNLCFLYNKIFPDVFNGISRVRKDLNFVTLFNKIRWLNITASGRELLGVYDEGLIASLSEVLCKIGVSRALIVHGQDGLDEISISAKTSIREICNGKIYDYEICPEDFGMKTCNRSEIVGGSPFVNASIIKGIMSGEIRGPKRDIVVLNAAAAIYLYRQNVSLLEAVCVAEECLESGKCFEKINMFADMTNCISV